MYLLVFPSSYLSNRTGQNAVLVCKGNFERIWGDEMRIWIGLDWGEPLEGLLCEMLDDRVFWDDRFCTMARKKQKVALFTCLFVYCSLLAYL